MSARTDGAGMADELHRLSAEELAIVQAYRHGSLQLRQQMAFFASCIAMQTTTASPPANLFRLIVNSKPGATP
jgi:hypothetical protein